MQSLLAVLWWDDQLRKLLRMPMKRVLVWGGCDQIPFSACFSASIIAHHEHQKYGKRARGAKGAVTLPVFHTL